MSNGPASTADARTRALGLLIGYLWARFGIRNPEIRAAWRDGGVGSSIEAVIDQARNGIYDLELGPFGELRSALQRLLEDPSRAEMLDQDYPLIRHATMDAGLHDALFKRHVNHVPSDTEFLKGLDVRSVQSRAHQKSVYDRIGGLWHVIRDSTEGDGSYNVSFLNIKRLRVTLRDKSGIEQKVTRLLPHFSLRSRIRGTNEFQTYRGRVVAIDDDIYFIGNREDISKFLVMNWLRPLVRPGSHADGVRGIITTVNADGKSVAVPMVAQFVARPSAADETASDEADDYQVPDEERTSYDALIAEGRSRVNLYTGERLREVFAKFGHESVDELLIRIKTVAESGNGRFFKL